MKPEKLDQRLAGLGLPDDLLEVGLKDGPTPTHAAVERIRQRALAKAVARPIPRPDRPRRSRLWILTAAVILAAIGLITAAGPGNVLADVKRLLTVVPGLGARDPREVRLALEAPVRLERGDRWAEVRGLAITDGQATLRLTSRDVPLEGNVFLEDATGRREPARPGPSGSAGSRSGETYYDITYYFTGPFPAAPQLTVVITGQETWRIPVTLVHAESLTTLDQFGPSALQHGYTVTASVTSAPDHSEVTILLSPPEPGARVNSLNSFPGIRWQPALRHGNWSTTLRSDLVESGDLQHLKGEPIPPGVDRVTLTIPAIDILVPGEGQVELPVCNGAIGQTVRLKDWEMELERAEVRDGQMKVWVSMGAHDSVELAAFNRLEVNGAWVPGIFISGSTLRLQTFEFPVPEGADTVHLTMKDLTVRLHGNWSLELPVRR